MTEPVEAHGSSPRDYGVGNPDGRFGSTEAGNAEDVEHLTEDLDDDDDVFELVDQINKPDRLEQAPEGCVDGR